MHHQIPPKYKIYLVGLTFELYEIPSQYERSVSNQIFCCFSVKSMALFTEKHSAMKSAMFFSEKRLTFQWKAPRFSSCKSMRFRVFTNYRSLTKDQKVLEHSWRDLMEHSGWSNEKNLAWCWVKTSFLRLCKSVDYSVIWQITGFQQLTGALWQFPLAYSVIWQITV